MYKVDWLLGVVCILALTFSDASFGKEKINDAKVSGNYEKDDARDAKLKVQPGKVTELRERFTSKLQAAKEKKEGLASGTHLGGKIKPGRPLGQDKAAAEYGIPRKNAEVRSVWKVEKDLPRKNGKVIGGAPGKGEIVTADKIKPENRVLGKPTQKSKK